MGVADASIFVKACLVVLPIALLLQIIGIATNYWTTKEVSTLTINVGLWKSCVESVCAGFTSTTSLPGLYS